jgi:hypothetical protein
VALENLYATAGEVQGEKIGLRIVKERRKRKIGGD